MNRNLFSRFLLSAFLVLFLTGCITFQRKETDLKKDDGINENTVIIKGKVFSTANSPVSGVRIKAVYSSRPNGGIAWQTRRLKDEYLTDNNGYYELTFDIRQDELDAFINNKDVFADFSIEYILDKRTEHKYCITEDNLVNWVDPRNIAGQHNNIDFYIPLKRSVELYNQNKSVRNIVSLRPYGLIPDEIFSSLYITNQYDVERESQCWNSFKQYCNRQIAPYSFIESQSNTIELALNDWNAICITDVSGKEIIECFYVTEDYPDYIEVDSENGIILH